MVYVWHYRTSSRLAAPEFNAIVSHALETHDRSVCTSICMYVSHDRSVCPFVCTCKCMYVSHDRSVYLSVCLYHMTGLFVHLYVHVNVCMYHMTGLSVCSSLCMYRLIHVDDHHSGHTDNNVDF